MRIFHSCADAQFVAGFVRMHILLRMQRRVLCGCTFVQLWWMHSLGDFVDVAAEFCCRCTVIADAKCGCTFAAEFCADAQFVADEFWCGCPVVADAK